MPDSGHEKETERKAKYVCGFKNYESGTKLNVWGGKICAWADSGEVRDQTWLLQPVGNNSNDYGPFLITSNLTYKHIVSKGPRQMVELSDGSPDDPAAHWTVMPLPLESMRDYFMIINPHYSNCVLDLAAGYAHNGNDIYCWEWHSGKNQLWQMLKY